MRILTWNIRHGAKSRATEVLAAIHKHNPDAVVLTEFRNNPTGLTIRQELNDIGLSHQSSSNGAPNTNSLLIVAREPLVEKEFPVLGENRHRCLFVKVNGINLFGFYFPQQSAKATIFDFILGLDKDFFEQPTLLLGDFNTGKHFIDEKGATFFCSEYFDRMEGLGWVDAWRHKHRDGREYTWYSQAGNGFRLDHAFVSPPLLSRVTRVEYSHGEREAKWSDHSALVVEVD